MIAVKSYFNRKTKNDKVGIFLKTYWLNLTRTSAMLKLPWNGCLKQKLTQVKPTFISSLNKTHLKQTSIQKTNFQQNTPKTDQQSQDKLNLVSTSQRVLTLVVCF